MANGLMRFNYLRSAPPEIVDRICGLRVGKDLHTPLAALLTGCLVVCAWWSLERYWLADATREKAVAAARLRNSRSAFAATKLVRANIDQLTSLDARLRKIRLSGSVLATRLVEVGNRLPSDAWLTSLRRSADGFALEGRAEGLPALSRTVANLVFGTKASSPALVRAAKEDPSKGGFISFTISLAETAE